MPSVHYGGRALGRVTFTADGRLPRCVGGCRLGFVDDSPLEEDGFEPSVPRDATKLSATACTHEGDREFADSPLEGDGFELLVPRHESPRFPKHPGMIVAPTV
jgi:hypothetical protein